MKIHRIWLIAIILTALLVACSGESSDDNEELPTRVVLGEVTPEVTDSPPITPAPENATEEAVSPDQAGDVPPGAETTPEAALPPVDAPPVPELTQEPGMEGQNVPPVPGTGGVFPAESNAVSDFSALAEGDSVFIVGTVVIEDDVPFIEDENGTRLELQAPLAMAMGIEGQSIQVSGEIINGENGLTITADAMSVPSLDGDVPGGNVGVDVIQNPEATAPVTLPEGLPPIQAEEGEVLEFQLDPELTLLETYDALVAELPDELGEDVIWTRASGSPSAGWVFDFSESAEDGRQTRYLVSPEGEIRVLVIAGTAPIPEMETPAIDRSQIVVDSDDVLAQLADTSNTPFGAPPLVLSVTEDGGILWTVQGPAGSTFDATTPLE